MEYLAYALIILGLISFVLALGSLGSAKCREILRSATKGKAFLKGAVLGVIFMFAGGYIGSVAVPPEEQARRAQERAMESSKATLQNLTLGKYTPAEGEKAVDAYLSIHELPMDLKGGFIACLSNMARQKKGDITAATALGWCDATRRNNPDEYAKYVDIDPFMANFSGYDGSYRPLEKALKETMHDPKSFEHVKTSYRLELNAVPPRAIVVMQYRGKNAFGAVVTDKVAVAVDLKTLRMTQLEE